MTWKTFDCGLITSGFSSCKSHPSLIFMHLMWNRSEFTTVLNYALIYTILTFRIRSGYYTIEESKRVRSIANLMVVYPLVYVICTIPLASARMASMSGHTPSLTRLCLCGAIMASNGWL